MCSMVLEILALLGFLTTDIYFPISIVVKNMKFRPFTTYILSRFVRIRFIRPFHGTVESNKSRDCCTSFTEALFILMQKLDLLWNLKKVGYLRKSGKKSADKAK